MAHGRILIGTSGWSYHHWRGNFYPKELPNERWLEHYTKHFQSVEVNHSFYQLPEKKILQYWYDSTPTNFVFTIKASRYITHMKKLKDPTKSVDTLLERIAVLKDKLGPILFQLPPRFHFNKQRLASFLHGLSNEFRYAFEFRDQSWHTTEAYDLLSRHKAAFCIYELASYQSPKEITSDFVYIRLHGPNGAYQGDYDTPTLSGWAGAVSSWSAQARDIFCYFDNDQAGYAAMNALSLQSMLQS